LVLILTSDGGQAVVGEFRMVLRKVNGSLGFTLQSTDETVLKHTVKVGVRHRPEQNRVTWETPSSEAIPLLQEP
jgi:hypothetical protein